MVVRDIEHAGFVGDVWIARVVEGLGGRGEVIAVAVMSRVEGSGGWGHRPAGEHGGVIGNGFGEIVVATGVESGRAFGGQANKVRELRRSIGDIILEILRPETVEAHLDHIRNTGSGAQDGGEEKPDGNHLEKGAESEPDSWEKRDHHVIGILTQTTAEKLQRNECLDLSADRTTRSQHHLRGSG